MNKAMLNDEWGWCPTPELVLVRRSEIVENFAIRVCRTSGKRLVLGF